MKLIFKSKINILLHKPIPLPATNMATATRSHADFNWNAHWDRKLATHTPESIDITMLVTNSVMAIDDIVEKMEEKINAIAEKLAGALSDQWSVVVGAVDDVTDSCDAMLKADVTLTRYNKYHDALNKLRASLQTVLTGHRIKNSAGLIGNINSACKKSDAVLRKVIAFTDANAKKAMQAKRRVFWQQASDCDDWMADAARQPNPVVLNDSDFEDVPDNFSEIESEQESVSEDDYDEDLRSPPTQRKRKVAARGKAAAAPACDDSDSDCSDSDSCSDCSDCSDCSESDSCSDCSDSDSDEEDEEPRTPQRKRSAPTRPKAKAAPAKTRRM
jgi:hypothetical protein